ncbi:unnamed protein product [Rotaria sordida]|uniref:Serpin domain-containing protein n=1 Tax=Rotaria sordida TaxID=392033 RepID=A0A814ZZH8_9BILA|nr:unnamed protein product [Rotaria sordida]
MASSLSSSSMASDFEHFGHKVYSTVTQNKNNQNVFLSPASIALAMSMCTVGSEAAAATAVVMMRCCASISPKTSPIEFKADRPFLFFIRENRQNIVLFSGKFVSPPTAS